MSIMFTVTVIVGVLCVLNLLLLFGVVRRLREYSEALDHLAGNFTSAPPELAEMVGTSLPGYVPGKPQLLGFFRAGCGSCVVQARQFVKAGKDAGAPIDTKAVVIGSGPKYETLLEVLRDVHLVAEPESQRMVEELEILVMPSFLRLDADGVVLSTDVTVAGALEPSQVRV